MSYRLGYPPPGGPPDPPELPEAARVRPGWPAWYGPVALVAAFFVAQIVTGVVVVATGADIEDDLPPAVVVVATLIQDVLLLAAAIFLASRTAKPRLWHFGLRRSRLLESLGWTVLGFASFLAFSVAYVAVFGEPAEQSTAEDVGVDEGGIALVSAGLLFVIVAPIVEEVFFRGFFYGALRNRFGVLSAAAISGIVFGAIHVFSGADAVPILAFLGFVFCLVYERTGSLYPVILLHAFNNFLAYGSEDAGWAVAAAFFVPMALACLLAPRHLGSSAARAAR